MSSYTFSADSGEKYGGCIIGDDKEGGPSSMGGECCDPPPAYEKQQDMESKERLKYLQRFDTVVLMDDSGSMTPLWTEAKTACIHIATIAAQHDEDGIDLHFLNHRTAYCNLKNESDVSGVFGQVAPRGITPLGASLSNIMYEYIRRYQGEPEEPEGSKKGKGKGKGGLFGIFSRKSDAKASPSTRTIATGMKPMNLIVFTDGAPSDDVIEPLERILKKMDTLDMPYNQIGVQFVQIGNSADATEFLKYLDDNMNKNLRDIIDTVKWCDRKVSDVDFIEKILLGGMLRKIDNNNNHQ